MRAILNTKSASEFESVIDRICVAFLNQLDGQYEDVLQSLQNARRNVDNSENLRAICAIAHKIAGIAKSVGFPELGGDAFNVDKIIMQFLSDEKSKPSEDEVFSAANVFLQSCENALADPRL